MVALVAGIILWLTRERLLPEPSVAVDEPRPHFRSTPPAPSPVPDDLTEIKGIGPVYARKLNEAGIRSFRGLTEIDAATIASSIGTTEASVNKWIAQAIARLG